MFHHFNPAIEVPAAPPTEDTTLTRELLTMLLETEAPTPAYDLADVRMALVSAALSILRRKTADADFVESKLYSYLCCGGFNEALADIRSGKLRPTDLEPS